MKKKDEQGTTYLIHVHDDDIGRVIGKGGNVIQTIRQIARVRATKRTNEFEIDVQTEDKPAPTEELESLDSTDSNRSSDPPPVISRCSGNGIVMNSANFAITIAFS